MRIDLLTVPNALCLIRLLFSPAMVLFAWADEPLWCLALFVFLLITDWLDGKLARALQQKTAVGAGLDSIADAVFYGSTLSAMILLYPDRLYTEWIWIGAALLGYVVNVAICLLKFRRLPSYHTVLAKTSWFLIGMAVISIFVDWSVWPLRVAMAAVTIANMEEIAITCVLQHWRADVPSIRHAWRLREDIDDEQPTSSSAASRR